MADLNDEIAELKADIRSMSGVVPWPPPYQMQLDLASAFTNIALLNIRVVSRLRTTLDGSC